LRVLETVIFTDQLDAVRAFYKQHFAFIVEADNERMLALLVFPEARLVFIDAASADEAPQQDVLLRVGLPFPELERARLITEGVACGELITGDWGAHYQGSVQYFTVVDPAGTRLQIFYDQFSRERQIITLGNGTGTRDIRR
jgi:hypothetical protein